MTAPGNQLLRLRKEFDVANAAAPEFDVMTLHRDRAMPLEGVHPPFHRMDVRHRGKVEIFPPDEGSELSEKLFARLPVARGDARLDKCRAFPVLAEAFVIGEPGVDRKRDLRGARIGP